MTRREGKRRASKSLPVTKAEPALARGVVVAVLGVLAALGLSWAEDPSPELVGALAAAYVVVVPLVQALWTRYGVTANAKVVARRTADGDTVVAGDAAAAPTGAVLAVDDAPGDLRGPTLLSVELGGVAGP